VVVGSIGFSSLDTETEPPVVLDEERNGLLVVASVPPSSLTLVAPVVPVVSAGPLVEVGLRGTGMTGTAPDSSTSKLELVTPTA